MSLIQEEETKVIKVKKGVDREAGSRSVDTS